MVNCPARRAAMRVVSDALRRKEHRLSSNPAPFPSPRGTPVGDLRVFFVSLLASAALGLASTAPLAAQDDAGVTPGEAVSAPDSAPPPAAPAPAGETAPPRINLSVTVPRGEVNAAQIRQCEDEEEASAISGEIVVCRRIGESGANYYSGSASDARKRYAAETAFKGSPATPDVSGLADNGKGISLGGVPPPALIIDVGALPDAPAGSDADRIARGLPPLGQDENLSAEEIRKRREALGLPPPAFEKKKGN